MRLEAVIGPKELPGMDAFQPGITPALQTGTEVPRTVRQRHRPSPRLASDHPAIAALAG
jgi:hypothetical protein